MNTNGARYKPGQTDPGNARPMPRFIETPEPAPVHDLLVMSHGPEAVAGDSANHACRNSFTSSSWIMSAGG
jgi:hypothetical protein